MATFCIWTISNCAEVLKMSVNKVQKNFALLRERKETFNRQLMKIYILESLRKFYSNLNPQEIACCRIFNDANGRSSIFSFLKEEEKRISRGCVTNRSLTGVTNSHFFLIRRSIEVQQAYIIRDSTSPATTSCDT